jgi:peptidoglycan/xylan/chitin deacetylase (PgdA/CDA1 family)
MVGFNNTSYTVSAMDELKPIYSAQNSKSGVSLMFNVYQNTDYVYDILDILEQYSCKATFFLGGSWADDNVDCVRAIYNSGNEIGSHGYFHKDQSQLNYTQNEQEIATSVKLLNAICGKDVVKLFAPPSGAFNNATLTAADKHGLKTIMWSRDTIDWRDSDAQLIYDRATKNLVKGEFVLMHPTKATVQALKKILTYISDAGLNAVTVSYNLNEGNNGTF